MAEAPTLTVEPAIGIDLGTTFSCVAVVRNGRVEVIKNEEGNFTTPSFVAFKEHERLIGDAAKRQLASNSTNTLFDIKRLIGRKFDDPIVQKDMQHWPFKILEVNGMPKIEVKYKGEVACFSPEEISAMVLGKMKEIAEKHLNMPVKNAVVTVPAYFNDMQRKATKDAGTIAGLNVTRIINEPTAAAIAYGLANDTKIAKNVLIYDLGGGTFDVSILNIRENVYEVKATGGDTHLGGEDFDNILMENFISEFKRKHIIDISGNAKALRKMRTACEQAKRTLSTATHASIDIDSLADGIDFESGITLARFNELCGDLFRMTIKIVKSALKDANLKSEDIDTVVLVGGSTRIPKIKQLLQELFVGKEINTTINADEAVAFGAAVQAAIIHGDASQATENVQLFEVTPLTLGVSIKREGHPNAMSQIIPRNTPIPVTRKRIYRTTVDNQTWISFSILQGESCVAGDNFKIGAIQINGIPAARARAQKVAITFTIDDNGILNATLVSTTNRTLRDELTIDNVCGSLTMDEIERMVADAEKYRNEDHEMKQYRTARSELEEYCNEIKAAHGSSNRMVNEKCNEIRSWLKNCRRPKVTEFRQMEEELRALLSAPESVQWENQTDGFDEDIEDGDEDVVMVLPKENNPVYVINDD